LLQTIDSTFATYSVPGHRDIWNPIDNAIAAIRYMYAGYGHIVGPSGTGYDQGGILPPGVTLAVNNTGKPEMVVPAAAGFGGVNVTVNVYGSVTSERDLAKTIRDHLVRDGRRNGGGMFAGTA
jgi:SLT domain-containing protein